MDKINIEKPELKDYKKIMQLSKELDDMHIKERPDILGELTLSDRFILFITYYFKHDILIAKDDNKIIGMIAGEKFSKISYLIKDIYIKEEYRHKNIGKQLVEKLTIIAKRKGFNRITLNCWEFNKNAKRFYDNLGFSPYIITYEKNIIY